MISRKIRRFAAAALAAAYILNPAALYAIDEGFLKGFGEAVAKAVGFMSLNQTMLYAAIANYHFKFNRWPASREELLADLSERPTVAEDNSKGSLLDLTLFVEMTFKKRGDGTLLIEARYSEETEKTMQEAGMGRFRVSAVASCNEKEYVFGPSGKAKNDRDYFTISVKMKRPLPEKPVENKDGK